MTPIGLPFKSYVFVSYKSGSPMDLQLIDLLWEVYLRGIMGLQYLQVLDDKGRYLKGCFSTCSGSATDHGIVSPILYWTVTK